ncbi:hypothetical protein D3C71_1566190 [compost metagenome]
MFVELTYRLVQLLGQAVISGLDQFLQRGQFLLPGFELRLIHGVVFVRVFRFGSLIAIVTFFRVGCLDLRFQLQLFGLQFFQFGHKAAHEELDQLVFQWAFFLGLVFQRGDDAGAPGIDHAMRTARHQGEEVVLGLVPETGHDATHLEGIKEANLLQRGAETGQQLIT